MPTATPPIPHLPHPDVAIVKHVFEELPPGGDITHAEVAASISQRNMVIVARRATTARDQLRREGISIVAVPGVGYHRETSLETLARHQVRERPSMKRKSRKAGLSLNCVSIQELTEQDRPGFFAERTINNIVYQATAPANKKRLLAAAKVSNAELPMARALEVLNGNGKE